MPQRLIEICQFLELNQTELLLGMAVLCFASVGGLVLVGILIVKLPPLYFCDSRPQDFWIDRHPVIRFAGLALKNFLGSLVVALGVVLAMPGIPGPGLLTMLIGVMLLDFPGKRRLERWLVGLPRILQTINRLRTRYGKAPLVLSSLDEHHEHPLPPAPR